MSSKTRANPDRSGIGNVRRRFFGTVTRRFFGTVIRTIEFRDGVFGQRMQSSRSTILALRLTRNRVAFGRSGGALPFGRLPESQS